MKNKDILINAAFAKFAGREVNVKEITEADRDAGNQNQNELVDPQNDPVVVDLKETAAKIGMKVRVCLPGDLSSTGFQIDRVNVQAEKHPDGKWRIGSSFRIG